MAIVGIYKILFKEKIYIGQSLDIQKRIKEHYNSLKRGKHHSKYLQRLFDKYGEMYFSFEVLKEVDTKVFKDKKEQKYVLNLLEQIYINIFNPELNTSCSFLSTQGYKASSETKQLQSLKKEKIWRLYHKNHGDLLIKNLKKYSENIGLDPGGLQKVAKGQNKSYKGYFKDKNSYLEWENWKGSKPVSFFKGVFWDKKASKWRASIKIEGKNKHLGFFNSETEAYEVVLVGKNIFYRPTGKPMLHVNPDDTQELQECDKANRNL